MSMPSLERFEALCREISHLGFTSAVLAWDQETAMPPKGARARSEQLSLIAGLTHERTVAAELGDLCEQLWEEKGKLTAEQTANVREMRRAHLREKKVPKRLVEEIASTRSLAHHAWMDARKKNDFPAFAPWLEKMFELKREVAESVGYDKDPYDALIDEYEPGMTVQQLNPLFEKLRSELVPMVRAIQECSVKPDGALMTRKVPREKQQAFGEQVARDFGFDFEGGYLAVSAHPFCSTLGSGDVRMTTRYNEVEPFSSFFGVLHETGHSLYEQGLDPKWAGLPMGNAISLGIHESQSRTWENQIGRGRPFWKHYFKKMQAAFAPIYDGVDPEKFYLAANMVEPSLIRVEADEVTYNLHILVRYEIERDFFAGKLQVKDLPSVWNAKYQEYLGITPPTDSEGVLQDVHWSSGLLGYFATYTLGNLYGAQLFTAARAALPELDTQVEAGNFKPFLGWLREKIHRHGQRWLPADLVKEATGSAPDTSHYLNYINQKFGPLYGIHGKVGA